MASLIPGFPNVPGVPQPPVPALTRVQQPASGTHPAPGAGGAGWGVYDSSNNPVAVWDTFDRMSFTRDANIPKYGIEGGSFGSYNKVQLPFDTTVRLVCGGDAANRQRFLDAIDAAWNSLDLYSIVVPEKTYLSANIKRYSFRREREDGAGLIKVDLVIEEVRVVQAGFTQTTQDPASASPQAVGLVQPQAPAAGAQTSGLKQLGDWFSGLLHP